MDPFQGEVGSQGPGYNFSLSPTGALVRNGDGRDVTEHLVPGWTTLAECPVFEILCNALHQCIYTKGEFGVCVQQPEHLYPGLVLSHTPMEGTYCTMECGEADVKGSLSSASSIPEERAPSTSPLPRQQRDCKPGLCQVVRPMGLELCGC